MITEYDEVEIDLTIRDGALYADLRGPGKLQLARPILVSVDIPEANWQALAQGIVDAKQLAAMGHELFKSIFHDELLDKFNECLGGLQDEPERGIRVRINTEAQALNMVPFATLCLRDDPISEFLALDDKTPVIQSVRTGRRPDLAKAPDMQHVASQRPGLFPLNMLVVHAAPRYYNLTKEKFAAWEKLERNGRLKIDYLTDANVETLQERLASEEMHYDLVHFVVHGALENAEDLDGAEGILLLSDPDTGKRQDVPASSLAETIARKGVRFVMLQACESGKSTKHNAFTGIAQRFAAAGVPAVIGMQYAVDVDVANTFADCFYDAWLSADTLPIERALTEARHRVKAKFRDRPCAWVAPALFMTCSSREVLGLPDRHGEGHEGSVRMIRSSLDRERLLFDLPPEEVASYVPPRGLPEMVHGARKTALSLLVGDDGIGKAGVAKLLGCALAEESHKPIKVFRARERADWSFLLPVVAGDEGAGLIILGLDAPLEEFCDELADIARCAQEKGTKLIMTADRHSYDMACGETRVLEALSRQDLFLIEIRPTELYPVDVRSSIFEVFVGTRELVDSVRDVIREHQKEIILALQDPSKLLRFVLLAQQARQLDDEKLAAILANAREISRVASSWIETLSLDQSYFAVTLVLFPDLSEDEFFAIYESLVEKYWRSRRPDLRILDYREILQLAPHVMLVDEGIRFSDPDFQLAVSGRLVRAHKRSLKAILSYLVERLIGPREGGEDVNRKMRIASARSIGEIAKVDLGMTEETLETLATDRWGRVRAAAGHALRQAFEERPNRGQVLALLKHWSQDERADLRWSAASAYGRIGRSQIGVVLPELARMAKDSDPRVQQSVAYAFRTLAVSQLHNAAVCNVLRTLASDKDKDVREEVAAVLEWQASFEIESVKHLLAAWMADPQVKWTAALALLSIGLSRPDSVSGQIVEFAEKDSEIVQVVLGRVVRSAPLSEGLDRLLARLARAGNTIMRQAITRAMELALRTPDPASRDVTNASAQKASEMCSLFRNWVKWRDEAGQEIVLTLLPDLASANPAAATDLLVRVFELDGPRLGSRLLDRLTTTFIGLSPLAEKGQVNLLYAFGVAPIAGVDKSHVFDEMGTLIAEEPESGRLFVERMLGDLEQERPAAFEVFRRLVLPVTESGDIVLDRTRLEIIARQAVELGQSSAIVWCVLCAYAVVTPRAAEQMLLALASASDASIRNLGLESAWGLMAEVHQPAEEVIRALGRSPTLRLDEVHEALGEEMFKIYYMLRLDRLSQIPDQDTPDTGEEIITITCDDLQEDGITILASS
ncbi:hypothetical protein TFLX_04007 [Thermoflexales bacterium]|nr:hypothetical protein TFLX_04007 [Thermoflexales bacterium]